MSERPFPLGNLTDNSFTVQVDTTGTSIPVPRSSMAVMLTNEGGNTARVSGGGTGAISPAAYVTNTVQKGVSQAILANSQGSFTLDPHLTLWIKSDTGTTVISGVFGDGF